MTVDAKKEAEIQRLSLQRTMLNNRIKQLENQGKKLDEEIEQLKNETYGGLA